MRSRIRKYDLFDREGENPSWIFSDLTTLRAMRVAISNIQMHFNWNVNMEFEIADGWFCQGPVNWSGPVDCVRRFAGISELLLTAFACTKANLRNRLREVARR